MDSSPSSNDPCCSNLRSGNRPCRVSIRDYRVSDTTDDMRPIVAIPAVRGRQDPRGSTCPAKRQGMKAERVCHQDQTTLREQFQHFRRAARSSQASVTAAPVSSRHTLALGHCSAAAA
jgi:hypothetical protein